MRVEIYFTERQVMLGHRCFLIYSELVHTPRRDIINTHSAQLAILKRERWRLVAELIHMVGTQYWFEPRALSLIEISLSKR
jgi:hypothetical protein